jgi:hypothetical protein
MPVLYSVFNILNILNTEYSTAVAEVRLTVKKWREKRQDGPPTSTSSTVKLSTDKLLQFGFTDSEIDTLFTTGFRMELNGAAHVMKLKTMVSLLRSMKISQDYSLRGAIVCGFALSEFDPKSNFVMNSTGISELEGDLVLNALFRKETPNESTNESMNESMNEITNESTDESADKSPQQLL